jgi:hypothetical protein
MPSMRKAPRASVLVSIDCVPASQPDVATPKDGEATTVACARGSPAESRTRP